MFGKHSGIYGVAAAAILSAGAAWAASPWTGSGPAAASAKPDARPALGDKAQIEALENRFAAAFTAKDVNRIMACYARQGLFVFDVGPPRQHVGWDDYRRDWEGFMGVVPGPVSFKLSDLQITVVGTVAYGHSVQDLHWTGKDGGATELVVRVTDVWRKAGGHWLIVQEHVSVPVDLDSGKGDLLSKP